MSDRTIAIKIHTSKWGKYCWKKCAFHMATHRCKIFSRGFTDPLIRDGKRFKRHPRCKKAEENTLTTIKLDYKIEDQKIETTKAVRKTSRR